MVLAGIQKYGGVDSSLGHAVMTRLYAGVLFAGKARLTKLYESKKSGAGAASAASTEADPWSAQSHPPIIELMQ